MAMRGSLLATVCGAASLLTAACSGAVTSPSASGGTTTAVTSAAVAGSGSDIQISGSASTGSPNAGASFAYTFQVKNSGPDAAAVTFTDTLPAGVSYNSATANGASSCGLVGTTATCDLGTVASGGQVIIVINAYAPPTVGTYANTGAATPSTPDPNTANNSVTVSVQVKTPSLDTIKVTKCYTNAAGASGGEMLIKASSSDPTARLFAYRPDGSLIGELQNAGGSRYGGAVMPYQPYDPVNVTIKSSSGGSITVPTTPFQV